MFLFDMSGHPVTQALVAQGVRPEVAAMLADAARRRGELANAQKETDWRQNIAIGGNGIYTALGLNDASEIGRRQKWANAPVENVKAQQAASDEAVGHAKSMQEFQAFGDARNPNSAISQATAKVLGMKPGSIPAALAPEAQKQAELVLKRQEERGRNARATEERGTQLETTRMHGESAEKVARIGADSRISAAELRADRATAAKPIETKASQQLIGNEELRTEILKMPKGMSPLQMNAWQNRVIDRVAAGVAQGRMSTRLLDTVKKFTPGVGSQILGTAEDRQKELLSMIHDDRRSIIDEQEATGHDTAGVRKLYGVYPGQAQPGDTRGAPTGRVKGTINGQTKYVDPENIDEAKRRGWTPDGQ